MRENHRIQPTLTEPWLDLPHTKELKAISDLLDQHPILGEGATVRILTYRIVALRMRNAKMRYVAPSKGESS